MKPKETALSSIIASPDRIGTEHQSSYEGMQAQRLATNTLSRFVQQRFRNVPNPSIPVSDFTEQIAHADVYTITQAHHYPLEPWGESRSVNIPLKIVDHLYSFVDNDGRITLFIDHTNCIVPTEEMFEAMAKNKLDPPRVLQQLFFDLSYPGEERKTKQYIQSHCEVAKKVGINMDSKLLHRYYLASIGNGRGTPMHCYLAGFGNINDQDNGTANVLRQTLNEMAHLYDRSYASDSFVDFMSLQSRDPRSLVHVPMYDVIPEGGNTYARAFKLQVARSAAMQLDKRTDNDSLVLPTLQPREVSDIVLHTAAEAARFLYSPDVLMRRLPEDDYQTRVVAGTVGHARSLGLTETNTEVIVNSADPNILNHGAEDIVRGVRLTEQLKTPPRRESIISSRASEWLKIQDVRKILDEMISRGARRDESSPTVLYGEMNENKAARIQQHVVIPGIPLLPVVIDRGWNDRDKTKSPFWELFRYGRSLGYVESMPEFITAINLTLQMYETDFWQRQIPQELQTQVKLFLDWLKWDTESLNAISSSVIGNYQISREFDRVKDIMLKDEIAPYNAVISAMEFWAAAAWLTMQTDALYKHVQALEYPMQYPGSETAQPQAIRLGKDYHPFHLVADQAVEYHKVKNEIAYSLRQIDAKPEDVESNFQHVGMRIQHVLQNADKRIHCTDFEYRGSGEYEKLSWFLSKPTIALIQDWHVQNKTSLAQLKGGGETYVSGNDKIYAQWGNHFSHFIQKSTTSLLEQFENERNYKRKREIIREMKRLAKAMYEVYEIDATNYSCSEGFYFGSFLDIHKHLPKIEQPFGKERIVPHGEVVLRPGTMFYVLGSNMAGKSTFLRSIVHGILLKNQRLPQPGASETPFGIRVDSIVGVEKQMSGESLLSLMIAGLNSIDEAPAEQMIWILDELGRRTSKSYGEALAMVTSIMALSGTKSNNFGVAATHYHDMPHLSPLLSALGIKPVFYVMGDDHRVHPLLPDENIQSNALAVMKKYIPLSYLQSWLSPGEVLEFEDEQEEKKITPDRINSLTRTDLFGNHSERASALRHILPRADEKVTQAFFNLFSDPSEGKSVQQLIKATLKEGLHTQRSPLYAAKTILALYLQNIPGINFFEARHQAYKNAFGISDSVNTDTARELIKSGIGQLNQDINGLIDSLNEVFKRNGYSKIDLSRMQVDFSYDQMAKSGSMKLSEIEEKINHVLALLEYCDSVNKPSNGYREAAFTDESCIELRGMWNPLLDKPKGEQVKNDFLVSFDGTKAGSFVNGENFSGKSNYIRGAGVGTWLSLCTGYGPADSIRINPKVRVLSLTQPVSDEIGKSSMAEEVSDRFLPAVLAQDQLKDNLLLTLFDEPGAPTSPEDAGAAITWLYGLYNKASKHAQLLVTSHCDQVPAELKQRSIPVELIGFRLLGKRPFKAFHGTADSNALEVAKKLGLNKKMYKVAKLVHAYIKDVENGADPAIIASHYAEYIKKLL